FDVKFNKEDLNNLKSQQTLWKKIQTLKATQ
ncbi:acyl carrier protein, partial [Campylobacter coli]|nr:acyl carrier protein [Campylobacter coli]